MEQFKGKELLLSSLNFIPKVQGKIILILIHLLLMQVVIANCQEEYKTHIKSIKDLKVERARPHQSLPDSSFLDYCLKNVFLDGEEIYISNRRLLKQLEMTACSKWYARMEGMILDSLPILVEVKATEFDSSKSKIQKFQQEKFKTLTEKIDGQFAFGATYVNPEMQISSVEISIGNNKIAIPDSAFSNFYNPNFCSFGGFDKRISVFTSLNEQYIYLYVYGGMAAGTYFAKLIFDHKEFKAKWVVDYAPLSIYGCFSERFIGF